MRSVAILALAAALCACDPAPGRVLTATEKDADLSWVFSVFDLNYAPREYKSDRFGLDYEASKTALRAAAAATTDNASFYHLVNEWVAGFQDAHTSSAVMASNLPGRSQIAYLGFSGVRKGDSVVVTEILPTCVASPSYPIHLGDEVIALDGSPLKDIVRTEIVRYRNLGYDEANLTAFMGDLFSRMSLSQPLPTGTTAMVKVKRGSSTLNIPMPWVVKDLVTFTSEQEAAAQNLEASGHRPHIGGVRSKVYFETLRGWLHDLDSGRSPTDLGIPYSFPPISAMPGTRFWNHFAIVDANLTWSSPALTRTVRDYLRKAGRLAELEPDEDDGEDPPADDADGTEDIAQALRDYLSISRKVPDNAEFLTHAFIYPSYVAPFPASDIGHPKYYGYIYIDTFSPMADEWSTVEELKTTLAAFEARGIEDVVIDTINNGGGSLTLGLQMARLFHVMPLALPQIRLKINEHWIDQFENESLFGASDTEKELARRITEQLKADRAAGKLLSDPMSTDVLMPFQFIEGSPTLTKDIRIALLVNETCVSMCDIFAATLQDMGSTRVIGARTMGGGGNVVTHFQSPNSHFILTQTESLILRTNGTPIENNGVTPDLAVDVNRQSVDKYAGVLDSAVTDLFCRGAAPGDPACTPADDQQSSGKSGGCGCVVGTGSAPSAGALLFLAAALVLVARRRRR